MTGAPARPAAPSRRPPRGRWRRRWYRAVVPFVVLGLLVTVTLVARFLQEPHLRDPDTLSPAGTSQDGSSELAALLAEQGVAVDYVTDIEQASEAVGSGGDAVIFVPRPTTMATHLVSTVVGGYGIHPGTHYRVVLVAPNNRQLAAAWLDDEVVATGARWASLDTLPGCEIPEAAAAGRAAAVRTRYRVASGQSCYDGGLVRAEPGSFARVELFVVGSTDPFRNRRLHEFGDDCAPNQDLCGNARLAVGLLSAYDRVIWLGALPPRADDPPEVDLPEAERPEVNAPERGERDPAGGGSLFGDLADNYGPAAPATLVLAVLLAVLVGLAMARRLGGPVSEPLPVVVPAAEAVAGRGRLYQRTRDQAVAMAALRTAAIRRLAVALGLTDHPPPEADVLVEAAVARTGLAEAEVRRTLYGPDPTTDQELTELVAALDALVQAVTREGGPS
jgi:hypothetical protein